MKPPKLYIFTLASMLVLTGGLFVVPTAYSSDFYQRNSALNNPEASDEIFDIDIVEEGQVFVVQTRSKGVEIIEGAKVIKRRRSQILTIEDENGAILRVFQGWGRGFDLIATAKISNTEALELLESGGFIVEELQR
ncbi:MAG: hypothetical protein AB3A66_04705 [Nodularia sp. CChRGM 3473]